jgi:ATP-dependent Lon protease
VKKKKDFFSELDAGSDTSAPPRTAHWIEIYDEKELQGLIRSIRGSTDQDFGLPQEDARRLAMLEGIAKESLGPRRRLLAGDAAMIDRLESLKNVAPSFSAVIDIIRREARASMATKAPMRLTPMILLGPPGYGKTHIVRRLATALGAPFASVSLNMCDDIGGEMIGHTMSWRAARQGSISRALLAYDTAAPVFAIDEIEKAMRQGRDESPPNDIWLSLFERENACVFKDAYLGLTMRAEHIIYLATANSLQGIPTPVLDRALVVTIDAPEGDECIAMARSVSRAFVADRPGLDGDLDHAACEILARHSPRAMSKLLLLASGFAADRRSKRISADDILKAEKIVVSDGKPALRYGFI